MASFDSRPTVDGAADGGSRRNFVNHLRVNLSLSEIRFDLTAVGTRFRETLPMWRFVTTPDHLQNIHLDMGEALDRYRARFGEISAVRNRTVEVRFDDLPDAGEDSDG